MSKELIRQHLESSLPPGIFWTPYGDLSSLLDALAEVLEPYYQDALNTADIRDPDKSVRILDLADEFAAEFFSNLTEDEIRCLVKAAKKGVTEPGAGDLELALNSAGFPVQIHSNAPVPKDPGSLIGDAIPFMVAGNIQAVAGNKFAQAGTFEGAEILINGLILATVPIVQSVAGNPAMVAGNQAAVAGYFENVQDFEFDFVLPDDPERWNQVYFVGGDAERAPDGEIITIEPVDIPAERQNEFENFILKYGPGDGWAGLFINYV